MRRNGRQLNPILGVSAEPKGVPECQVSGSWKRPQFMEVIKASRYTEALVEVSAIIKSIPNKAPPN
ncbi:MAG: hypothetical protein IPJ09_07255 [Saprospiraceae bacterium]|nr:hypothetical protein [Saprospiraceae bacterium]